jgi:hypothetical protein
MRALLISFGILFCCSFASAARAQAPCCSVTAIDVRTGVISAKVNANGETFEFKINDARVLPGLRVGQPVYANFAAKQISLDGRSIAGPIISGPQAVPAPIRPPAAPRAALPPPTPAAAPRAAPAPTTALPASAAAAPAAVNQVSANPSPKEEKAPTNPAPGSTAGPAPTPLKGSWYLEHSFQPCCEYVAVPGQPSFYVTVNGQPGWYLYITPIPGYRFLNGPGGPNGGYAPIFVNFWTRTHSLAHLCR